MREDLPVDLDLVRSYREQQPLSSLSLDLVLQGRRGGTVRPTNLESLYAFFAASLIRSGDKGNWKSRTPMAS